MIASLARSFRASKIAEGSAAPHCPAGHFSPYSDGEKLACRALGA